MAEGAEQTFTQAEFDAAVAAAVAPLQSELEGLRASQADSDVAARIAAAVDPLNTQVASLQSQLDEAEVARQAAQDRADGIVAWLDAEGERASTEAAVAARRDVRAAQAKEVAGLTAEYLDKVPEGSAVSNLDRFAAMADDAWQATVDGWEAQREAAGLQDANGGPPKKTAMTASTDRGGRQSALSEVAAARVAKTVDLRPLSAKR